jgi:hypothetical protein
MVKVFHGSNNVAGSAELIAQAQRTLGFDATSVCMPNKYFSKGVNLVISDSLAGRARLLSQFSKFDVFHFYFSSTLLGGLGLRDINFLRKLGKQVFLYFCGCDIRDSNQVISTQEISACAECWPQQCHPKRKEMEKYLDVVDGVFVSTPDLLEFAPNAVLLPQPVDLSVLHQVSMIKDSLRDVPIRNVGGVKIVHAPSNRAIKGTRHLISSVEELKARGLSVELVLVENKSHSEALHMYSKADIAVDQLLIGSYGQFAVEMMALGIPVVCNIREDLRSFYPSNLPIVSADPRNLTFILDELIKSRHSWTELGKMGQRYASDVHDPLMIATTAASFYRH